MKLFRAVEVNYLRQLSFKQNQRITFHCKCTYIVFGLIRTHRISEKSTPLVFLLNEVLFENITLCISLCLKNDK